MPKPSGKKIARQLSKGAVKRKGKTALTARQMKRMAKLPRDARMKMAEEALGDVEI